MASFKKLVRFTNSAGKVFYGEVGHLDQINQDSLVGSSVQVYQGDLPWDDGFRLTDQKETIDKVRGIQHTLEMHTVQLTGYSFRSYHR